MAQESNNITRRATGLVNSRVLASAATGGVNRAVDTATRQAISNAADRTAQKFGTRRKSNPQSLKMNNIFFLFMLFVALFKDISDLIFTFSIFLSFITPLVTIAAVFIFAFYYFWEDISIDSRKVAWWSICFLIELIPLVNAVVPAYTASLIITRILENRKVKKENSRKNT